MIMADEVFRPTRKKVTQDDVSQGEGDPLGKVKEMQEAIAQETGQEVPRPFNQAEAPFEVSGNVPPEFRQAMQQRAQQGANPEAPPAPTTDEEGFETWEAPPERPRKKPKKSKKATGDKNVRVQGSDALEGLLQTLVDRHQWEIFELPSKGKFYDNIPEKLHIRAMTGEEEQILATPRWVRRGKAIDMIFQRCIQENIRTEDLLSVDRTHLLIFLRGISYTPEYDVEIKCPACTIKFSTVIDLNDLEVDGCPDDFDDETLSGTLPTSGFNYSYRLATGADEQEISNYRERRIQQWGDQSEDDTLLYRTALLLEDVEGVTQKKELALLLKRLPINDVAHLRNEINEPPFGVDTEVPMICPSCTEEFEIDLPLETNFFFPRKREERTQA
jgi:hypothetical protein